MGIDITPGGPVKLAKSVTTTGNFTLPSSASATYVVLYGAGGGGNGGSYGGSGQTGTAGGVAAGWMQVSGGQVLSVTIGAGGAAGSQGGITSIDTNSFLINGSTTNAKGSASGATSNVNLAPSGALPTMGTITFSNNLSGGAGGPGGGQGRNNYGQGPGPGGTGGSGAAYFYL